MDHHFSHIRIYYFIMFDLTGQWEHHTRWTEYRKLTPNYYERT